MNKKSPENVQDEAGEMGRPGGCVKNYMLYIKEACGFHLKTGPIQLFDGCTKSNQTCSYFDLNV